MRHAVAPLVVLALLIAPSIADFLASRGDACVVAPCCIGKMSKSCPMHPHPTRSGRGMRSCGNDEQVAVAHQIVAVLAVQIGETAPAAQALSHPDRVTPSYHATTPPDPPPPRLS